MLKSSLNPKSGSGSSHTNNMLPIPLDCRPINFCDDIEIVIANRRQHIQARSQNQPNDDSLQCGEGELRTSASEKEIGFVSGKHGGQINAQSA